MQSCSLWRWANTRASSWPHYSGTGAAEMAFAKIAPGRVKFHSACDLDPICREVLRPNHPMECAAEHVSKDLCQRPPPRIVDALRAELQRQHERLAARASTPSEIALEWVGVAMNILKSWTPRREDGACCVRHVQLGFDGENGRTLVRFKCDTRDAAPACLDAEADPTYLP